MEKKYPIGDDTKLAILKKHYFNYYRDSFPSDERTTEVVNQALCIKEETEAILKAMDEYAAAPQGAIGFADKSQLIREYKQYKENLTYLGGPDEWTFEKVNKLSKMEAYQAIMGFNSLINFLDNVLYAYEEGAKDWEERCLKAEAANEKTGQSQQPGREAGKEVLEFIRDVAENWDCDEDGHKYNTGCRKCSAAELLYDLTRKRKEVKP